MTVVCFHSIAIQLMRTRITFDNSRPLDAILVQVKGFAGAQKTLVVNTTDRA